MEPDGSDSQAQTIPTIFLDSVEPVYQVTCPPPPPQLSLILELSTCMWFFCLFFWSFFFVFFFFFTSSSWTSSQVRDQTRATSVTMQDP